MVSFSPPYFASEFHLSKNELARIFSAHQVGTLVGGIGLVYLGDIFGRRPLILFSIAAFGVLTACYQFANGYGSLVVLRFLTGVPLGGVLPLLWALDIEFAPRTYAACVLALGTLQNRAANTQPWSRSASASVASPEPGLSTAAEV